MMSYQKQNKVCTEKNSKNKLRERQLLYCFVKEHKDKENTKKINKFKQMLPTDCRNCNILTIIDMKSQKVYCPYMINDKCILN